MTPSNFFLTHVFLRKITITTLGITSVCSIWMIPADGAPQASKVYRLKANQGVFKPEEGPSLHRDDMQNAVDPFETKSQTPEDTLEPPASAFQVESDKPSAPPKFNLNAIDGSQFTGRGQPGFGDGIPQQERTRQKTEVPNLAPPSQVNNVRQTANEPDGKDMQLAWDEWHKRLAEAIYTKISTAAVTLIPESEPLICVVNYTVTKDRRVVNVHLQQNSSNLAYNTMVYAVVSGMTGNPVLQFPQGSRRITVDKLSTFSHNASDENGFQYITGDKETLKKQNQR